MARSTFLGELDRLVPPGPPDPLTRDQISFYLRIKYLNDLFPEAVATSFHRTTDKNRSVGGVSDSLHLDGLAIDEDIPGADLASLEQFAHVGQELGLAALVYFTAEKSYVHFQFKPLRSGSTFSVVTT